MRRLLFIAFLLVAVQAQASTAIIVRSAPTGCVEKNSQTGATAGNEAAFRFGTSDYWATTFTPSTSYTVCRIDVPNTIVLTPTANIVACIYNYDGVTPTPSTVVDCSDAVAASANMSFTSNFAAAVTAGTTYAIVFYSDAVDADNYVGFPYVAAASQKDFYDDDGAGTWTAQAGDRNIKYTVYGQ